MPGLKMIVGGSAKGVGKTSLVCGLIAALPDFAWTAVKITSDLHGSSEFVLSEFVLEDRGIEPGSDTSRFLKAGAEHAFLVTAAETRVPLDLLWNVLGTAQNILIESTRIAADFTPDIRIGVLGNSTLPVKPSFGPFLKRADALVAREGEDVQVDEVPPGIPLFRLANLTEISAEMLAWLQPRMSKARDKNLIRS